MDGIVTGSRSLKNTEATVLIRILKMWTRTGNYGCKLDKFYTESIRYIPESCISTSILYVLRFCEFVTA